MKININRAYILLLLTCLTGFFGLYKVLPLSSQLYSVDLIYMYILAFSVVYFLFKSGGLSFWGNEKGVKNKIILILISLFMIITVEVVISFFNYHQGMVNVFKESMYYYIFVIVGFLLISTTRSQSLNMDWFCKRITNISILCSTLAIIIFSLYTFAGIDLLGLSEMKVRNGTVQYGIGTNLVIISIIISMTRLINEKVNKIDLLNLVLGIVQIFFLNKTRAVILYLFFTVCLMCLRLKKTNKIVKFLLWIGMIGAIIFLLFGNQIVADEISSFVNSDYGMLARMDAIEFYISQFIKNPLFGMGFISTKKSLIGWELLYGNNGVFYRGDVGVIGLVNGFGLIGLTWAILFLKHLYKSNNDNSTYSQSIKFIVIYFSISCLSLCFMDAERLMTCVIPLIMVMLIEKEKRYGVQR